MVLKGQLRVLYDREMWQEAEDSGDEANDTAHITNGMQEAK